MELCGFYYPELEQFRADKPNRAQRRFLKSKSVRKAQKKFKKS